MHDLQRVFATAAGEERWAQDLHALFGAGALDEAEAILAEALTSLDTELAWSCLELPREAVEISGWEELGEAIAIHEGEPVTCVTIAIANEQDRDFEKGQSHHPYVLVGVYTDEAYEFSKAVHWELLDQCHDAAPGWAGKEEDIEVHLDVDGLDALNTKLVHHKQRHFLRDGEVAAAPARYVEYVLGCWWRALRWHQAVATECELRGLPGAVPVIAGMVSLRPEVVAIHDTRRGAEDRDVDYAQDGGETDIAVSFGSNLIKRGTIEEEVAPPSGSDIRRRALAEGDVMEKPARSGLWARIFGRN